MGVKNQSISDIKSVIFEVHFSTVQGEMADFEPKVGPKLTTFWLKMTHFGSENSLFKRFPNKMILQNGLKSGHFWSSNSLKIGI